MQEFFFDLIVPMASVSMLTNFLNLWWFPRKTRSKGTNKCQIPKF